MKQYGADSRFRVGEAEIDIDPGRCLVTARNLVTACEASKDGIAITSHVSTVTSDVSLMTSDVSAIPSDVSVVTPDVFAIASDVTATTSDVRATTSDVTGPTSDMPETTSDVYAITSDVAEREGFEPSVPLRVHMISNHAPSATRSSLQGIDAAGPRRTGHAF